MQATFKAQFSSQELFIGEVGIKDYGDKDNDDLKQRFKLEKEDFPGLTNHEPQLCSVNLKLYL